MANKPFCKRCLKPKSICKCGRPEKITPEVLHDLEVAFMNSFTDEEAALYAKIGVRTLYKYIERNPEFGQRKEQLKLHPNLKAKQTIVSSLGQLPAAQWWADRKSIDLMPQSKVVHAGKIETETKGESTQQVKEIVTRFESELKSAIAKAHGK